jgi:hypothetical protein
MRFSLLVRVTHWLNTVSFVALVVSGVGILLAHPRFYWGETGGVGAPSLFDLPLPFMLGGPSGWGPEFYTAPGVSCRDISARSCGRRRASLSGAQFVLNSGITCG